ncbi:MAG: rod-binding protein [SAR324 cluster bacterium]|nr:rod-binding protein [SAR324 cluster bacterium]
MTEIRSDLSANFLLKQSQNLDKLGRQKVTKDNELREVASEFESLFVNQLLDVMRNSVPESELLPNNHGEKVFHSMLDQEYAKIASKSGKFGLAELVYQQLKPRLEK